MRRRNTTKVPLGFEVDAETLQRRREDLAEIARRALAMEEGQETIGKSMLIHANSLKTGALKRSLEFSISDEYLAFLMKSPCGYCGIKEKHRYSGVDRVNNKIGYTVDNVVACCRWCNYAKGTRPVEDFKAWLAWVRLKR